MEKPLPLRFEVDLFLEETAGWSPARVGKGMRRICAFWLSGEGDDVPDWLVKAREKALLVRRRQREGGIKGGKARWKKEKRPPPLSEEERASRRADPRKPAERLMPDVEIQVPIPEPYREPEEPKQRTLVRPGNFADFARWWSEEYLERTGQPYAPKDVDADIRALRRRRSEVPDTEEFIRRAKLLFDLAPLDPWAAKHLSLFGLDAMWGDLTEARFRKRWEAAQAAEGLRGVS